MILEKRLAGCKAIRHGRRGAILGGGSAAEAATGSIPARGNSVSARSAGRP